MPRFDRLHQRGPSRATAVDLTDARLARMLGAKKPMRVPRFVGRLAAGEGRRRADDRASRRLEREAKRELGWRPAHPSWRQDFQMS